MYNLKDKVINVSTKERNSFQMSAWDHIFIMSPADLEKAPHRTVEASN